MTLLTRLSEVPTEQQNALKRILARLNAIPEIERTSAEQDCYDMAKDAIREGKTCK